MPAETTYTLENLTRSTWLFPFKDIRVTQEDGSQRRVFSNEGFWVGDKNDTDEVLMTHGIIRNKRCPSPVLQFSLSDYERLAYGSKRTIQALVDRREFKVTPALPRLAERKAPVTTSVEVDDG